MQCAWSITVHVCCFHISASVLPDNGSTQTTRPNVWSGAMAGTPIQVDLTNETPPDWIAQGATTPQPQICAICLQDTDTAAVGPDVPFEWPACRNPIHLQCAIQHVSHHTRPACPTCRQQWTREGGLAMEQARSMHQVPWMVPETPYDSRTHHLEAPPAQDHLIPLCCPRLVLIDHCFRQ